MLARIARTLIAFVVLVAAYYAYARLAAPWIEPKVDVYVSQNSFDEAPKEGGALGRYQTMLARYFKSGHWALVGKPKVIRVDRVMLVLDDYEPRDDGRLTLTKFIAVFFPDSYADGQPPPGDAVVLEAPGGGWLQFDEPFNPARGRIGNITSAAFPGPITIRSEMKSPGDEDDLLIQTRDLRMNGPEVYTDDRVDVRQGRSTAGGRRMVIRLAQKPTGGAGQNGLKIGGIESMEIFDEVKLALSVGAIYPGEKDDDRSLTLPVARRPAADPAAAAWGAAVAQAPAARPPAPPVEISCQGSFKFDLVGRVASFRDDVHVWQLNLTGQSDQLICQELRLHFESDASGKPGATPTNLRPQALEAIGQPVKLDSPARGVRVRCDNLRLDIEQQLATLSGRASISHSTAEVEAPVIRYRHPPKEQPSAVGDVWLAGPGSLRATPDGPGGRTIEAQWQAAEDGRFAVALTAAPTPEGAAAGPPAKLLSIVGAPRFSGSGIGEVLCQRIDLRLLETPADGPEGPALEIDAKSGLALLPERLDAAGPLRIDSPRLVGSAGSLVAKFLVDQNAAAGGGPALGSGRGASPLTAASNQPPGSDRFSLTAKQMQLDLSVAGKRIDARGLRCRGDVVFEQLATAPGPPPLAVRGEVLNVGGLEKTGAATIDVFGSAAGNAPPQQAARAMILARGLELQSAEVHLDQAAGRMWADGEGDAKVLSDRDLLGGASGPTELNLRWEEGLRFDGSTISVRGNVLGEGPHDWLRCRELTARLSRPVDFRDGGGNGAGKIEIAQVDCVGGVAIDHRTVDPEGQRSHERAKLVSLSINQQTGAIQGAGPGWVRSVHYSNPEAGLGAPGAAAAPAAGAAPKSKLHFLRVDFQQGISGNINDRVLRFHRRVQAIYGPVDAWEQQVELDAQGRGPVGAAQLACEELQVYEDPAMRFAGAGRDAKDTKMELRALGGVRLAGMQDAQTRFEADAEEAVYNQAKDMFVLAGDARRTASLSRTSNPNLPPATVTAQKISYWRDPVAVKVEGLGAGRFDAQPAATAARPATPR
ncbi:OstA-like protein [Pirellulimonas nuda]|uniref:OstA-like protein n=1 Tax=Pirellulimonas nuda TaxID=2528009 RepID=A0A518DJA8_9BACT|nr:hypothetical protein [Pirellulimonas nuda]QDU91553.1 OstA-like protein [Pirellulimonas nuda]